jgi:hypothetical protein
MVEQANASQRSSHRHQPPLDAIAEEASESSSIPAAGAAKADVQQMLFDLAMSEASNEASRWIEQCALHHKALHGHSASSNVAESCQSVARVLLHDQYTSFV